MNLLANETDTISSTGQQDSILIAYNDLRKVNGKLIELEYEKRINKSLRTIINNDSVAINSLINNINNIRQDCDRTVKKYKKERNIASGIGLGAIILLIISLL